jgi:hypothetical protein
VNAVLSPEIPTTEPLMALDRCDRCGAQAYLRVTLASGGELLFCAHHGKKYEQGLRSVAAEIHDETAKLVAAPKATAEDH